MQELPREVRETYQRLKGEYPFYISISRINKKFYVYRHTTRWDRERRKIVSVSEYLGRILDDGRYIKKRAFLEAQVVAGIPAPPQEVDKIDEKILMTLSMNARFSLVELGKQVGLSPQAIYHRIRSLEKKFGIKFLTEINIIKLGYLPFIAFVKFREERPALEAIKEVFAQEPRLQLALFTTGKYDMVLYFTAEDNIALSSTIGNLRSSLAISSAVSEWYVAPLYTVYGFIPLRDKFFDLLKNRVWKRTRDRPRPGPGELTPREFSVLRETNNSGKADFSEIDKKHNLPFGSSRYIYNKFKEKGVIKRSTLSITNPGSRYNGLIIMNLLNQKEFNDTRRNFMFYISKNSGTPISRFTYAGDIEIPDGEIFIMPVFNDGELEQAANELKSQVKGITTDLLVVSGIITGEFCHRRYDNSHSEQHRALREQYKHTELPQPTKYG